MRAAGGGFDPAKTYESITLSIPPVLTAGAVPVVALSLLCKAATGSGLPGPLGLLEGLAWLTLPLGAGSLLPRVGEIVKGGDFSTEAVLAILGRDNRGESASERVDRITRTTDPNSALGMQLADLERARAIKAAMTPEQLAEMKRRNSELAKAAISGVGSKISKSDIEAADAAGSREKLLSQPVAQTMAQGMTTANYGRDVTKMSDEEMAKVNLSSPELKPAKEE